VEKQAGDDSGGLSAFSKDVVRAALVDMVSKALVAGTLSFAALIALLIWQGGSVPAWLATLLVALALAAAYASARRTRRLGTRIADKDHRIAELEPVAAEVPELEESVARLEWGLDRHEFYTEHIAKMLDQLQRVVARDIEVPIPVYIERGILQPARDLLMKDPAADVRLSVLMPSGERWKMVFAAGHSVAGQTKYNERIADTLSRLPLETGETHKWSDVIEDDRFRLNPKATREIHAMISLPLWAGDNRVGVLNVVSSLPDLFDQAEFSYVESLASIVSVAISVHLQDQLKSAETDK
jgi:hypothetical protein